MAKNLIERILKTIRNYDMLKVDDTVIAAVSGGPDSVFLLYVLNHLKNKLHIKKIIVCNLDHGIRGLESRQDSLFVKRLTERFGLKFLHKKISLKKSKKLSTEEQAREERYKFFKEVAERVGTNVIATGHTLDDQAETVLMRLIKGSSLKGIIGIAPAREDGDVRIIRPLLELEKEEIKKFLDEEGLDYRIDSTNLEPIYFRNIVRNEIIPFLQKYNPRLKRALFNLAEHLREDFEFIEGAKENLKFKMQKQKLKKKTFELNLKDIVIQPKALQKEILRDALDRIGGEVKRLSFRHWKEMERFIKYKRRGNSMDLPGAIRLTRLDKLLVFHRLKS